MTDYMLLGANLIIILGGVAILYMQHGCHIACCKPNWIFAQKFPFRLQQAYKVLK